MEFKAACHDGINTHEFCINRIRLEFKDVFHPLLHGLEEVLIESDWNLKIIENSKLSIDAQCINRIRLEFKDHMQDCVDNCGLVLIESDWNLK